MVKSCPCFSWSPEHDHGKQPGDAGVAKGRGVWYCRSSRALLASLQSVLTEQYNRVHVRFLSLLSCFCRLRLQGRSMMGQWACSRTRCCRRRTFCATSKEGGQPCSGAYVLSPWEERQCVSVTCSRQGRTVQPRLMMNVCRNCRRVPHNSILHTSGKGLTCGEGATERIRYTR